MDLAMILLKKLSEKEKEKEKKKKRQEDCGSQGALKGCVSQVELQLKGPSGPRVISPKVCREPDVFRGEPKGLGRPIQGALNVWRCVQKKSSRLLRLFLATYPLTVTESAHRNPDLLEIDLSRYHHAFKDMVGFNSLGRASLKSFTP